MKGNAAAKSARRYRAARVWSNRELRRIAPLFEGDVVNVSAGDDVDKEGSHYRDYFRRCASYTTTNFGPGLYRGFGGRPGELLLDLSEPLEPSLRRRFDTVFNHTTLEHVFEVTRAFANVCELTRDTVILVVPFVQMQHQTSGYQDYWRLTPTCVRRLFSEHGLQVVYESWNDDFNTSVYLFFVAAREPGRWAGRLPETQPGLPPGHWIGEELAGSGGSRLAGRAAVFAARLRRRLRPRRRNSASQ